MTMKGIDISNYQRGLDLGAIDYDFVFCKATEGTGIVHDTCDPFIQKAIGMGKCWGFYHFLNKEDPIAQANYFYESCKNYFGAGVPMLDYEDYGRIGTDKAKQFLDRIYELTGVRCIVYISRSVCTEEDWSAIAPNHALWVAQYADNNETGYQDSPWLASGTFGAWDSCAIHQYTSHGRISGLTVFSTSTSPTWTPPHGRSSQIPTAARKLPSRPTTRKAARQTLPPPSCVASTATGTIAATA